MSIMTNYTVQHGKSSWPYQPHVTSAYVFLNRVPFMNEGICKVTGVVDSALLSAERGFIWFMSS